MFEKDLVWLEMQSSVKHEETGQQVTLSLGFVFKELFVSLNSWWEDAVYLTEKV